jgi:tetratricopeptide (TPR) repeat protein
MNNALEYIENYFSGNLPEEEKSAFEKRIETDPVFAEEVGFYIASRGNIRQELHRQKKKEFDSWYAELATNPDYAYRPAKQHPLLRQLLPYLAGAVAACCLLVLGWMLWFNNPSPQQLASTYVEQHLSTLAVTMSGEPDSLQRGIAAFNRKDTALAESIFQALANHPTLGWEAIKNLGILYLVTGRYDQALDQFDALSANKNLYANPGPFYKAITLMKRSQGQDREEARALLQQVIERQLPGNQEAVQWIKRWDAS